MLHNAVTTGDLHIIYNWTAGSSSALATIPVSASDVGKVAFVTANSSFYVLQNSTPTWQALGGGGGGGGGAALSAGTQSVSTGTVNFANSNNITFGMSNSSQVTASYNFNASAGTTSGNVNALTFANSNGVSFGLNAGTITATVKTDYQSSGAYLTTAMQSNAATISNINISAGTTSTNASAFTFSNSNGVTFGLGTGANAGVVTASVAAGGGGATLSAWEPENLPSMVFSTLGQNSIYFTPFVLPQYVAVDHINAYLNVTSAGSSATNSCAASSTIQFAIYYRDTANTSQLLTSISNTVSGYISRNSNVSMAYVHASPDTTYSVTSNGPFGSLVSSQKLVSLKVNSTLSPGEYWLAIMASTATVGGVTTDFLPVQYMFGSGTQTNATVGFIGVTSATAFASFGGIAQGVGTYSSTSGAFPNTVVLSSIRNISNQRLYFNLVNYGTQ